MSAYNARQLKLMLEILDMHDAGKMPLSALIQSLDGLVNALEKPDESWRNLLLKKWGVLEDAYAYALDRGFPTIPSEHMKFVRSAVGEIRDMVSKELPNNGESGH